MKKSNGIVSTTISGILLLIAGTLLGQNVQAHHSSAAVYEMNKTVSVTGTITQVRWVNPHAYFVLEAKNKDGTVMRWEFLLNSPNEMMRAGWPRDTLKPGDVVTVEAIPGRGDPTKAFAMFATFPDGRKVLASE